VHICRDLRPAQLSIINNEYIQAARRFPFSPIKIISIEPEISFRLGDKRRNVAPKKGNSLISRSSHPDE